MGLDCIYNYSAGPLWVNSRHLHRNKSCPLWVVSDMCSAQADVRYVPKANIVIDYFVEARLMLALIKNFTR